MDGTEKAHVKPYFLLLMLSSSNNGLTKLYCKMHELSLLKGSQKLEIVIAFQILEVCRFLFALAIDVEKLKSFIFNKWFMEVLLLAVRFSIYWCIRGSALENSVPALHMFVVIKGSSKTFFYVSIFNQKSCIVTLFCAIHLSSLDIINLNAAIPTSLSW